ncbi:MAG: TerB family tellurite resistance protein [Proteobacteria bacterium]|nr:TerB family tellurite resistance protein [Pseudomonadota bacterium]
MFARLIEQIGGALAAAPCDQTDPAYRETAIRKATAVLMIDVARADHAFDPGEFDRVLRLVEEHFDLAPEDAAALVNAADEEARGLTSLHDFTQLLHRHLDEREKARIVGLLWEIAYADGRLDMYEDSLVLKISDLLHVSRGRVMRLKHDAAPPAGRA